jgi:Outer membrane protein
MKKVKLFFICVLLCAGAAHAQTSNEREISIQELFDLVKQNHPSLKVSQADVAVSSQKVEEAKSSYLPDIKVGVQAFYLGDATILDKNLSNSRTVEMPHTGNALSIDASELVWKGGALRNNVKLQEVRNQIAKLSFESNEQSIKLLVLSYFLDLKKLQNQQEVYAKSIELAEQRLVRINKFYGQGMVTRNDLIRGELQLSNLKLALEVIKNNETILNQQLCIALGLDESTSIIPDRNLLTQSLSLKSLDDYRQLSGQHPTILIGQKSVEAYTVASKIVKTDFLPSLSIFASNKLQRPITTTSPVIDMYSNGWSAGVSLNFNLDALYKAPRRIKTNRLESEKANAQLLEAKDMLAVSVNAAYIKYNEAILQNKTLEINKKMAVDNYRIMESRYNNQLVLMLDLLDASNTMLDAELQYSNSQVNIIYTYFKLLKECGSL